jgi:Holliday junction resolvase RusA-like endonuclease
MQYLNVDLNPSNSPVDKITMTGNGVNLYKPPRIKNMEEYIIWPIRNPVARKAILERMVTELDTSSILVRAKQKLPRDVQEKVKKIRPVRDHRRTAMSCKGVSLPRFTAKRCQSARFDHCT